MKKGHVAKLDINVLLLKHPAHKFETFEDEVQYIINHDRRNKFIRNLALDLKGNTLILFSRVEGHGQPLYDLINNGSVEERHVFFVHGGVATEDREQGKRDYREGKQRDYSRFIRNIQYRYQH